MIKCSKAASIYKNAGRPQALAHARTLTTTNTHTKTPKTKRGWEGGAIPPLNFSDFLPLL